MSVSVSAVVRRIIKANVPLLCVHTCSLLDVMREKFSADQIGAALYLLERARTSPAELTVLIAEQVDSTLAQHMDSIERESRSAVGRIERAIWIFAKHGLIQDAGSLASAIQQYPAAARVVVERFISVAQVVKGKQALYRRAYDRISAN